MKTREVQLNTWADLVLKYQKHTNQAILNVNDENTELFINKELNRRLPNDGRLLVLEHLERTEHAAPIDKKRNTWEIYWNTLDEWANMIYKWATDNAMTGTVCTLFEITNGDQSTDQEFHELDAAVLLKAIKRLEAAGKCEHISFDDNEGVKFFWCGLVLIPKEMRERGGMASVCVGRADVVMKIVQNKKQN